MEGEGDYAIADGGGYNDPSPNPGTAVTSQQLGSVQRSSESQPTAWNPFTWNWNAAGRAFQQGTSHYEGASAEQVAQGVAGDLDLFDFGALRALGKSIGGPLSGAKFYKAGQPIGTPFPLPTLFLC